MNFRTEYRPGVYNGRNAQFELLTAAFLPHLRKFPIQVVARVVQGGVPRVTANLAEELLVNGFGEISTAHASREVIRVDMLFLGCDQANGNALGELYRFKRTLKLKVERQIKFGRLWTDSGADIELAIPKSYLESSYKKIAPGMYSTATPRKQRT